MAIQFHFPSLKLAIETFLAKEKPKAFTYRSIIDSVKDYYHILCPVTVGLNHQRRQRNMDGAIMLAIPKVATVKRLYARRSAGLKGVELWDGTVLPHGKDYYKLIN